ncbi:hypothetical protein ALC57_09516 [Trachymyrmex cornetzi]|uniref:Uncharacterized protein n=1 Tax=Trachymyrmex cornetzi TaxID=471704 RepID=A0A195DZC1_9HYME|nr:hypothetical protein ALC57_09516 [Trachymyrmex cornetzi]
MNGTRMRRVVETLSNSGEHLGEVLWSHFSCRHALHTGAQPTLISRCAIEKIIESESRPPARPRIAKTAVRLTTLPVRSLELLKHQQKLRVRKVARYSQHDSVQPEKRRWIVNCYTGIRSVRFLHGGIACPPERYYRSRIMGDTLIRR